MTPEEQKVADEKKAADDKTKADKADKDEIAALRARLEALEKPKEKEDPGLGDKAKAKREADEADKDKTKKLERALSFGLKSADFLKSNESLLPKDAAEIFKLAEKENYTDAVEKDAAIKSELVKSFFSVQSNMDLLTSGQRASLEEFQKLTKAARHEKAQGVYEMVFEPAFEMLKRVKRAESLKRDGEVDGDDAHSQYKKRLIDGSRKHYLGEK